MERKKELLVKVLKKLQGHWSFAEGVLALVESSYIDNKAIDGVIHIIVNSIKSVKNIEQKTTLEKWLEMVQKIRSLEEQEEISEKDLDQFLLDNL